MANERTGLHWPRCTRRLAQLLPEEFWMHHRQAKRHRILGWCSVLDAAAARLEEPPTVTGGERASGLIPDAFWVHRQAAREEDLLAFRSLVDELLAWWDAWLEEPPPAVESVKRVEVE